MGSTYTLIFLIVRQPPPAKRGGYTLVQLQDKTPCQWGQVFCVRLAQYYIGIIIYIVTVWHETIFEDSADFSCIAKVCTVKCRYNK